MRFSRLFCGLFEGYRELLPNPFFDQRVLQLIFDCFWMQNGALYAKKHIHDQAFMKDYLLQISPFS